ncbi:MAG TPA: MBL fold metallo-hydrolase [bacterium]|nr:MBL fold metallo-hydrolase [bacterium]
MNKRLLITIFILSLIVGLVGYFYFQLENKKQEVVFLDVGQGDSTLINLFGNNEVLIDGGPDESVLYGLGKFLPLYDRSIELMIITHAHDDHLSGLIEVLQRYAVKEILMTCDDKINSSIYNNFLELLKIKAVKIICAEENLTLDLKNAKLEIIYPSKNCDLCTAEPGGNNSSLVFKITLNNGQSFLFTGDIEAEAEEEILKSIHTVKLAADILKVPHHGSDTSLTEEFLQAVKPKEAIIFVGADNKFGHPSLRTIKRLERNGVEVKRTDLEGSIRYNE